MGPRGFLPLGRGAHRSPRGHVPVPEACGHGPASLPLGWAPAAQDHLFIFGPLPWRRGGFELGFHQQQRLGERRENNTGGEKSSFSWAEMEGRGRDPATEPASRPLPPPDVPILLPSPRRTISAHTQPGRTHFVPIVRVHVRGNVPVPSLSTHGGSPGCSHRCGSKPGDVPSICSRSALAMGAKFRVPACQAALGPLLSPCKACGRRGTRLQVGKCWQAGCELRPVLPALPRHRRQK